MISHFTNIRADKSLGQNFLQDENILESIAGSVAIADENILEIGPGYGALTEYIITKNPKNLELVEFDPRMIAILENRKNTEWKEQNIKIHHADVLDFFSLQSEYSVIANIPYYITSPILFHFLHPGFREKSNFFASPKEMTILMQKEVGEKIIAKKGKKIQFSYLSLAMHLACDAIAIVIEAPKTAFRPEPKVDSVALHFRLKKNRDFERERALLDFWNQCFVHPRKTLIHNLALSGFEKSRIQSVLSEFGYSEKIRAEAIDFDDWNGIFEKISL